MASRHVPELTAALLAAVLRGAAAVAQWSDNPAVRVPTLDAAYYLDWSREIAAGHLLSAGPAGAGGPYLLNPLYAWMIAPFAGASPMQPWIMALQVLLGAATAWLTAAAARRWTHGLGGRRPQIAAWIAGLAVAFSTSLVHLSTHVSVATLAALLIAGALHAAAPATDGNAARRGHGPSASGLWLGLGALARPVTLLVLPFFAALHWRRGGVRAGVLVVAVFAAFAGLSFARNVAVSGEPVVFTAANGLNLHLGQNPLARRTRSMMTDEFRFAPVEMHVDAKHRVGHELGREPTRAEVSAWYRDAVVRDVRENPGPALAFTLTKAWWFFSPAEPPSSADLVTDREAVPLLYAAIVPTWLLAILALACAARLPDRRLLMVAGGVALAHLVAGALAFPLSHYRAPAVPALALLVAAGAVHIPALPVRQRVATVVAATVFGIIAWVAPQPGYVQAVKHANDGFAAITARDGVAAERAASAALEELPDWYPGLTTMADAQLLLGRRDAALTWIERAIARQPWSVPARHFRAELLLDLKRPEHAEAAVEDLVSEFAWSPLARGARGEIRAFLGNTAGAREDLQWAVDRGFDARADALARAGLAKVD